MGLSRLILLILFAALAYRLWKRWRSRPMAARPVATSGHMLACAQCGMYVPEQDAVHDGAKVYCCVEHQRAQHPT